MGLSSIAHAWDYEEHKAFGDLAFQRTCAKAEYQPLARLLAQAGPICEPSLVAAKVAKIEPNVDVCAEITFLPLLTFGDLQGLAGDLVDSPFTFLAGYGPTHAMATSASAYLRLAHDNASHFAGEALLAYETWHSLALAVAEKAAHNDSDRPELLRKALVIDAFASHFLTDGFSAGHIIVDRRSLPDHVADHLHDRMNKYNDGKLHKRECTDPDGPEKGDGWWRVTNGKDYWCPTGDGSLRNTRLAGAGRESPNDDDRDEPEKRRALERIVEATSRSIDEVFRVARGAGDSTPSPTSSIAPAVNAPQGTGGTSATSRGPTDRHSARSEPAAALLFPRRPSCAEQAAVLGGSLCFSSREYAEWFSLGVGVEETLALASTAETITTEVGVPFSWHWGVALKANLWSRTSQRYEHYSGASIWLPSISPNVFLRTLPRRSALVGIDWIAGVKVGYPLWFRKEDEDSFWGKTKATLSHFPDMAVYLSAFLYSLEIRGEIGWGMFTAFDRRFDGGPPNDGDWNLKRGGRAGVSLHYGFFQFPW